jgi:hypothetical protein
MSLVLDELEGLMMDLVSAYNAAPHLHLLLVRLYEEGAIDRELREKLRQLTLLCTLLRNELVKIEEEAERVRRTRRWG